MRRRIGAGSLALALLLVAAQPSLAAEPRVTPPAPSSRTMHGSSGWLVAAVAGSLVFSVFYGFSLAGGISYINSCSPGIGCGDARGAEYFVVPVIGPILAGTSNPFIGALGVFDGVVQAVSLSLAVLGITSYCGGNRPAPISQRFGIRPLLAGGTFVVAVSLSL